VPHTHSATRRVRLNGRTLTLSDGAVDGVWSHPKDKSPNPTITTRRIYHLELDDEGVSLEPSRQPLTRF